MTKQEFAKIRHRLGKSQKQMAQLLGISVKAIQSFEQGWRKIPIHSERQALLLLALKASPLQKNRACWSVKQCPPATKRDCPAWELKAGQMCWLINGTICEGKVHKSWSKKIQLCRKCEVFAPVLKEGLR